MDLSIWVSSRERSLSINILLSSPTSHRRNKQLLSKNLYLVPLISKPPQTCASTPSSPPASCSREPSSPPQNATATVSAPPVKPDLATRSTLLVNTSAATDYTRTMADTRFRVVVTSLGLEALTNRDAGTRLRIFLTSAVPRAQALVTIVGRITGTESYTRWQDVSYLPILICSTLESPLLMYLLRYRRLVRPKGNRIPLAAIRIY